MTGRPRDRGAASVELAILLPVLIMLVGGAVDFGDALRARVQLQEAVQDGSSYAAYNPEDLSGIRARVNEASSHLTPGPVTIACSGSSPTVVTVRASYTHYWLMGLVPLPPVTMTAEAQSDVLTTKSCG